MDIMKQKQEAAEFDADFQQLFKDTNKNVRDQEIDDMFAPVLAQKRKEQEAALKADQSAQAPQTPTGGAQQGDQTNQDKSVLDKGMDIAGNVADAAGAVASDIGKGVRQAPRRVVRGAIKGVNGMLDFVEGVTDLVPTLTMLDEQGNYSYPRLTTQGTAEDRQQTKINRKRASKGQEPVNFADAPQIPNLAPAKDKSVTGDAIEGITQFLVGFKGVDKIAKATKYADAAGFTANVAKGALADLLAFDSHEQRLSDVIERVPALKNPVTKWLAGDDNDGFLEGKAKQAIEGAIGGALGEALFRGIGLLKKGKTAAADMAKEGATPDDLLNMGVEDRIGSKLAANDFKNLGEPDSAELIIKKFHQTEDVVTGGAAQVKRTGAKLDQAAKEAGGVPAAQVSGAKPAIGGTPEIKINFARIEGEDDVKRVMQQLANDPDLLPSIQAARRGTQDTAATLKGAQDIDGFDELLTRRMGEAFNDQQTVAARKVYYDTTEKLLELAERAASPQASDIDQFMFRKMMAVHHAVQKEVLGARAEAGRALRAWSIPLSGSNGSKIKDIENILNEFGGVEAAKDLAKRLTAVSKTGELTTAQINTLTNGGALARTGKALINVWQMGLLTSPRTHIVNVTSNVMTGLTLGAEKFSASLMKDTPITAREAVEYYVGYVASFREALSNAATAFKTGQTGMGLGKIDLPPVNPTAREILDPDGKGGIFSKALSMYGEMLNKYVGGGLAAGDEFAKTTLYRGQMRALATRQGVSQGLQGKELKDFIAKTLADPSEYMKADAVEFAAYGTYTNALEGGSAAIQKFVANVPAARLVVPFVRTPINIFKFTFGRTPIGLLSQKMRDDIAAGGLKRSQALAKLGTGTSFMMLGTDMALNGQITGAGPTDPETRSRLLSAGWKPYSIKINDRYYSYARFEPFATWLGMSADITEILGNYEAYDVKAQEEIDELVTASVAAMANQVVGKTFLSGVADLTQVLSDSKRFGPQYLQSYAGSLVPNIVADLERAASPEREQVFNMIDAIKARIPGLSDSVPKRMNVYGEKVRNYTPGDGIDGTPERLMQIFNPVIMSDPDAGPQKLDEWFLANGIDGPNMPRKVQTFSDPRSFGRDRIDVDLREFPEIYQRFLELRGEVKLPQYQNMTMKNYLTALVDKRAPGSAVFFNAFATDKDRQESVISGIVADYDRAIRDRLVREYPVLQQKIMEERDKQKIEKGNQGAQGLVRQKAFP